MWNRRHNTNLWSFTACYTDSFNLLHFISLHLYSLVTELQRLISLPTFKTRGNILHCYHILRAKDTQLSPHMFNRHNRLSQAVTLYSLIWCIAVNVTCYRMRVDAGDLVAKRARKCIPMKCVSIHMCFGVFCLICFCGHSLHILLYHSKGNHITVFTLFRVRSYYSFYCVKYSALL
jgi:hypothetical protein